MTMALVSDTGSSATDKITSNPAVKGVGQANTAVPIREGGAKLGTAMADGTGAWSFTPSGLADGAHTLTASQTDLAGNTGTRDAEPHPRQDRADGKHGAGLRYRRLVDRQDDL